MDSASMKVDSINDLCVLAAFSRLGLVAERTQRNARAGVVRTQTYRELNQYVEIELTGERFENEYLEAPAVRIHRLKVRSHNNAS